MNKGGLQESAPPYPGPPLAYGGGMPPPGPYPQPGVYPGPPPAAAAGYHPVPQPGVFPQQGFAPGPPGPPGPPAAGYYGGAPYAPIQAVPVTNVTQVLVSPALRDFPGQTVCPHCQRTVVTQTTHTPGLMTWAFCGGLAVLGLFLCCCIPFCIDACQDVEHRCPSCRNHIFTYKRM